jgi:hypothetical protein
LRVFELGLGTNNIYIPSSMGAHGRPGASLYGWSEFFPHAKIFGADIDKNILFHTDTIKTFYCDQTKKEVIEQLWKEVDLTENFDIIIEDGLHTFDANVCFFENSIHKVKPSGYYIIEDIIVDEIDLFEKKINDWKIAYPNLLFDLITIPSDINNYDNTVLVVYKLSLDHADSIKYIVDKSIEGDIIECGVENGRMEYIFIHELMKHNMNRDIYLFDTFAGLTEPGEYDYTCKNAVQFKMDKNEVYNNWNARKVDEKTNHWCFSPLENVQHKLNATGYPQEKLHYIVGDVMETLKDKQNIPTKIAILRLDTDWYESSKFELEQMYENVVSGGIIIFDDYYLWDGQRRAVDEFFEKINVQYDLFDVGNNQTAAIIKK